MQSESISLIWQRFRNGQMPLAVTVVASVVMGLTLASVALGLAWSLGMTRPGRGGRGDVRDLDIGLALALGGLIWSALLAWLWRAYAKARLGRHATTLTRVIRPIMVTGIVSGLCVPACVVLDGLRLDDTEVIVTAVALLGGAIVLAAWIPMLSLLGVGRPLYGSHDHINVNCPQCGYSLVGLVEARCPECGAGFTLDQLLAAQHFSRMPRERDLPTPSEPVDAQ
jgi:hypothetical protein